MFVSIKGGYIFDLKNVRDVFYYQHNYSNTYYLTIYFNDDYTKELKYDSSDFEDLKSFEDYILSVLNPKESE